MCVYYFAFFKGRNISFIPTLSNTSLVLYACIRSPLNLPVNLPVKKTCWNSFHDYFTPPKSFFFHNSHCLYVQNSKLVYLCTQSLHWRTGEPAIFRVRSFKAFLQVNLQEFSAQFLTLETYTFLLLSFKHLSTPSICEPLVQSLKLLANCLSLVCVG